MFLLADSNIHCPKLEIDNEELKNRVELELAGFKVNVEKLECLERIFNAECDAGLASKKCSSQLALERSLEASAEFSVTHHVDLNHSISSSSLSINDNDNNFTSNSINYEKLQQQDQQQKNACKKGPQQKMKLVANALTPPLTISTSLLTPEIIGIDNHIDNNNQQQQQLKLKLESTIANESNQNQLTEPIITSEIEMSTIANAIHNSVAPIATYEDESTALDYGPQSKKSTFLMANTFIPGRYPNGQEVGDYLALDLGSTNFRVLWSTFNGGSTNACDTHVRFYDVPFELRHGECKKLFDFLASCISNFVDSFDKLRAYHSKCIGTTGEPLKLGFTFSFPTDQTAIDRAVLLTWTKSFNCPDAIGQNVVQLLQDAIDRRGNLRVRVIAILNDTTGTLLQGRFVDPNCCIGMIVGSGGNICYLEKLSTINKLTSNNVKKTIFTSNDVANGNGNGNGNDNDDDDDGEEVVIDIESGAFGDDGKINFIHTKYDETVDKNSLFKNSFTFEKLYGGNFLGEICRYIILDFAQQSMLFNGKVTPKMTTKYSLLAAMTSAIESPTCNNEQVCQILHEAFDLIPGKDISHNDTEIVRFIVARLFVRNALILSACLAALIKRMNKKTTTIAVDGSVYKKHPKFHRLLTDFTAQLAPNHQFKIIGVEDGSGRGGALAAAIADELANETSHSSKVPNNNMTTNNTINKVINNNNKQNVTINNTITNNGAN